MLGKALQRFPAEVQAIEIRIRRFQPRQDAQRVRVVVEPAGVGQRGVQGILARVTEGRMAKIVSEAQRFGQVLVEPERARHCAADLRDFDAVGQADAEVIAVGCDEHLRLVAKSSESDRMDDPVAVALEDVARAPRTESGSRWRRPRDAAGCAATPAGTSFRAEWHNLIRWGIAALEGELTPTVRRSSAKVSASLLLRNGPTSKRARSGLLRDYSPGFRRTCRCSSTSSAETCR